MISILVVECLWPYVTGQRAWVFATLRTEILIVHEEVGGVLFEELARHPISNPIVNRIGCNLIRGLRWATTCGRSTAHESISLL